MTASRDNLLKVKSLNNSTSNTSLGSVVWFYVVDIIFAGIAIVFLSEMYKRVVADKEVILRLIAGLPDSDLIECLKHSKRVLDHIKGKILKGRLDSEGDFYIPADARIAADKKSHRRTRDVSKFQKIKVYLWPTFLPLFVINFVVSVYSLAQILATKSLFSKIDTIETTAN